MVKWCFVIVTLCYYSLAATAIQSTRRLALPIFSEVLLAVNPEPVVTNSSSLYAPTKTVLPQTTITTLSTTGSFLLLTLPSLNLTVRTLYQTTAEWIPPTRKTTRFWKPTWLPLGNRTAQFFPLQDSPYLLLYQVLQEHCQRWEQFLTLSLLLTRPYPRCQPMKLMRLPNLRTTIFPCYL